MTSPPARRVYLHVGAPKTGTTYLQDKLDVNARELAAHDVHVPSKPLVETHLFHFRAALDLLGEDWGGPPGHAEGSWDALVRRVRRRSGTVLVSHEILAAARPEIIAKAKRDLGVDKGDTELHIVYTVRDLGRQIPAAWQESIKQGRRWAYRRFLRRLGDGRTWFSRAFDLPAVLAAWGAGLPPEHVHVVTVPRHRDPGSGDDLWHRFCRGVGIDPAWGPEESKRTNQSLGVAEAKVLLELNRRLERSTRRDPSYDDLIRGLLAEEALVGRDTRAVAVPPRMQPWAERQAERWIEWIEASGVDVVGDLDELRPVWREAEEAPSGKAQLRAELDAALDALAAMTQEAARRMPPEQQLVRRVRNRGWIDRE